MRSAPAASTASTSAPSRAKSAERIDGAIQTGSMATVKPIAIDRNSSCQARERFAVLFAGARNDLGRQFRSRRLLVPVEGLQVVAYELLVEARRAHTPAIAVRGPEARGVRRQHFVDERQPAVAVDTEFELGVGDDDAAAARVFGREAIQRERGVAYRGGKLWTDERGHFLETDVLIVSADLRLGRRREQRLRQTPGP